MNKNSLVKIPELSSAILYRARSLFGLKALLGFPPEVFPQLVFVRIGQVTRWNE